MTDAIVKTKAEMFRLARLLPIVESTEPISEVLATPGFAGRFSRRVFTISDLNEIERASIVLATAMHRFQQYSDDYAWRVVRSRLIMNGVDLRGVVRVDIWHEPKSKSPYRFDLWYLESVDVRAGFLDDNVPPSVGAWMPLGDAR